MSKKRRILVLTGGGDCPGLNAVIRGIYKRSKMEKDWEVIGSIEAFNGVLKDPQNLMKLTKKNTSGIHVKGGTILKTTNKGHPFEFPVENADGTYTITDRSDELIQRLTD
ncbi:MAG: 6-phosphofructokinase, partial [Cyclobacteriaceae bacterium]